MNALQVYVTSGHVVDACAISLSLLLIVLTSVVLGTGLPFMLAHAGVDPANAGTSIQVIMVRGWLGGSGNEQPLCVGTAGAGGAWGGGMRAGAGQARRYRSS